MAKIIFAKRTLKCHVMFTSLCTCRSLLTVIMVLVKRWDSGNSSFIYLFVLVLLGYARVGRYHLELKFDNHVMLSVTAFFIFMFLWWIYTIHAVDPLSFLWVLKLLSVLLSFYYQFSGLVWFSSWLLTCMARSFSININWISFFLVNSGVHMKHLYRF